jgi:hypothetical protein
VDDVDAAPTAATTRSSPAAAARSCATSDVTRGAASLAENYVGLEL